MDSRRQAESILKIKTFHTTKCRAYPHEKLNTSKRVISSKDLVTATEEEIASAPGKQGVTNIRRISIRKGWERIQTNTYIPTFNQPHTPKEVKIGYCLERVEQYVSAPLRCFKCQKYGHHREACRERQTCAKCAEKEPDLLEEDCLKEISCANRRRNHPTYVGSCNVYKRKKMEILEVKHKRNVSFLEAMEIVGSYNQDNKYRALGEKLIQWEANDWHLKKLHLAEFYSATGWEWGEIQYSPNKNARRIYHSNINYP